MQVDISIKLYLRLILSFERKLHIVENIFLGNGFSYGRPGFQDEPPPPFPGLGEHNRGPPDGGGYADGYGHGGLIYQGQTVGGRPLYDARPTIGSHLAPPLGGPPPFGGHPAIGGVPPIGGQLPAGGFPPNGGHPGGYLPPGKFN